MRNRFLKSAVSLLLGCALMSQPIEALAKDNRDAGIMSKFGSKWISSAHSTLYESQNEGGFTVYVPYNMMMPGQERFKNMFTKLFDIYSSKKGENYPKAFGLWSPTDIGNINGIETKYYTKFLSTQNGDTESVMATSDLGDYCPEFNIEYRYSGILIDKTKTQRGTVVTNPTFVSDFVQSKENAGSKGIPKTYIQYDKSGENPKTYNLKLIESQEVVHPQHLKLNWTGGSGIPDNVPTESPYYDTAEKVFEEWASRTEIGAKYKEAYQVHAANMGTEWWKILQKYVRIDGDLRTQTVLLTMVYSDVLHGGHVKYRTFFIPFPIQNNVIAYSIQVIDDKGEITEKSERPVNGVVTAVNGADALNKNIKTGEPLKLQRNKTYNAELGMMFASTQAHRTVTDKTAENAKPQIQIWLDASQGRSGGGRESQVAEKVFGSENVSDMSGLNVLEDDLLDRSRDSAIVANSSFYASLYDTSKIYNAGLAAFNVASFTVDEAFPTKGHLRFIVPDIYTDNGDNEYKNDDYIDLDFEVEEGGIDIPDDPQPEQYGDMNLGRREYRALHYKKTEEENDLDKPIMTTDPKNTLTTGKRQKDEKKKLKIRLEQKLFFYAHRKCHNPSATKAYLKLDNIQK